MRVGEILLEHGWVEPRALQRAISEHRLAGKRLCSLLVARGLVEFDQASRALAQQHGVAAALAIHLERRDRKLATMLPSTVGRASFALPLGRTGRGELVICVRDPSKQLAALLEKTAREPVTIAVAPASKLEPLIDAAYEPAAEGEYDVDMSTGPIPPLGSPDYPGIMNLDADSLALVDLDDAGVYRDPTQVDPMIGPRTPTMPPFRSPLPSDLTAARSRDAAIDAAMRFAAGRWSAALLVAIDDGRAPAVRGHGGQLTRDNLAAVVVPLSTPSLIDAAYQRKRSVTRDDVGPSAVDDRLVALLGSPRAPCAAPIVVASRVVAVLVVGDPAGGGANAEDLERIASALADSFRRYPP